MQSRSPVHEQSRGSKYNLLLGGAYYCNSRGRHGTVNQVLRTVEIARARMLD